MGEIEWAMWANEQAIVSAIILLIGAIIGVIRTSTFYFNFWQCAAAAIPISVFVYLFEYPRGKRKKGRTIERKFQGVIAKVLDKLKPFSSNYFVRFIMYMLLSVPCCFLLPTLMGGLSLQISAVIYLVAAVKGEQWSAVTTAKKPETSMVASSQPPTRPPPRAPRRDAAATANPQNGDGTANRY